MMTFGPQVEFELKFSFIEALLFRNVTLRTSLMLSILVGYNKSMHLYTGLLDLGIHFRGLLPTLSPPKEILLAYVVTASPRGSFTRLKVVGLWSSWLGSSTMHPTPSTNTFTLDGDWLGAGHDETGRSADYLK